MDINKQREEFVQRIAARLRANRQKGETVAQMVERARRIWPVLNEADGEADLISLEEELTWMEKQNATLS